MLDASTKPRLTVLLASPRGFCAGVDRAIQIVEQAIAQHGAPVYVRHEIVHNRYVVEGLEKKGAIFVEELEEIPDDSRPVIFSAHGVPKSVPQEAKKRDLYYLDATCPLVSKVHIEAERHFSKDYQILLIGHRGHPEVIGTMGQLPEGTILLVESVEDAERIQPADDKDLAYITQTTLSIDDTAAIVEVLQRRFPNIEGPRKQDICYATTNRQQAVKAIAGRCDTVLVIGATNSSNSLRLVEVATHAGASNAFLVQRADDLARMALDDVTTLGITAGASAPEILVDEVLDHLRRRFELTIEEVEVTREDVHFKLPKALTA
ncbi:MAG: 4-hydroxy-3-methylbut-2-enyl diphosphate reductase [Pseudomonadota bacterium]